MNRITLLIRHLLHIRIIRFFLVAGLNVLFGTFVYFILRYSGLHFTVAAFLGQIISIFFNFKTYGALVFKNRDNKLILRFLCVYAILYVCNVSGIWGLNLIYPEHPYMDYIGALVMLAPVGFLGYFLNKTFVYKTHKSELTFEEDEDEEMPA